MEKRRKLSVLLMETVSIVFIVIGLAASIKQYGYVSSTLSFSCFNGAISLLISLIIIVFFLFQKTKKTTPIWLILLKLASLCGTIAGLLLSFSFSYPVYDLTEGTLKGFVLDGGLYLSLLLPIISFISFFILNKERKSSPFLLGLFALTIPVLYSAVILVLYFAGTDLNGLLSASTKAYISPSFVAGNHEILYLPYASFAVAILYLIGVLFAFLIKKKPQEKAVGDSNDESVESNETDFAELNEKTENQCETQVKTDNQTTENVTENEVKEPENRNMNTPKAKGYAGGPRVYHISKQPNSGLWQVKLASGKKPIKLFKTQAEAIGFAKQLSKTQSGSIRVHSKKGTIRKE